MPEYSDYDAEGRIHGTFWGESAAVIALQLLPGRSLIDGRHDGQTHYVSAGAVTARPTQATTLAGQTLSNLPAPCTLWIDQARYAVDTPTVTLDLPVSGTYRLRVEAWPHQDWAGSLTV